MPDRRFALPPLLALCIAPTAAAQQIPDRATLDGLLGAGQVFEDFETYTLMGAPEYLNVALLDHLSIANGQGPGLVQPGASYADPGVPGNFSLSNDGWFGLETQTIVAGDQAGPDLATIVIEYDPPVQAMGIDITGFEGLPQTGTMTVMDTNGSTLGTIPYTYSGAPNARTFAGWRHDAGIRTVVIHSPTFFFSPVVDDHGYGQLAGGLGFCFGDGTGSACPCGNGGGTGEGCANSSAAGAAVELEGSTSIGADDLAFHGSHLLPAQPGLLFVGESALNGGDGFAFGDGLRCVGVNVVRLGTGVPDGNGDASWGPGLGAFGSWSAGDTRFFQVWYRDPNGSPCGSGFNLSHGTQVVFGP